MVLLLALFIGFWSSRRVKDAYDYDMAGRAFGLPLIVGSLYGSFVGGTSLIGTSQLAFLSGVGAIWFTLGGAVGIAIMGYIVPAIGSFKGETIPQLIEQGFGSKARAAVSIYMSLGILIQIIAQVLAAITLLVSLLPVSTNQGALIAVLLIFASVWSGGIWGTGLVGMFKTILMTIAFILMAFTVGNEFLQLEAVNALPAYPWFFPFPRGFFTDFGAGLAVCIGTISTQTYWQPLFASRSVFQARMGAFLSAGLIFFMGCTATLTGMTEHMANPGIPAISAMPSYIQRSYPDLLSGIILGGLLLSVVITGSGLTLGLTTVLSRDIYQNLVNSSCSETRLLWVSRLIVLLTLSAVLAAAFSSFNSMILQWAFFSMALRGVATLFPLLRQLFGWGPTPASLSLWGIYLAPLVAIMAGLFSNGKLDPLYTGLFCYLGFWLAEYKISSYVRKNKKA